VLRVYLNRETLYTRRAYTKKCLIEILSQGRTIQPLRVIANKVPIKSLRNSLFVILSPRECSLPFSATGESMLLAENIWQLKLPTRNSTKVYSEIFGIDFEATTCLIAKTLARASML
jgi:hypothetical protein